jgi:hypothetical protein
MKMMNAAKWGIVIGCIGFMALASQVRALDFGDIYDLGSIMYGIPSGDADRTAYVNELISLAPGATNFFDPVTAQTYNRSLSVYGAPYPTAVFALNGTGTSINLGVNGYQYLFAKYDGTNAGSEVWDVNGLTGTIMIPANGLAGQNYGLSGWTLFNPGPIPEPGAVGLVALGALGLIGALRKRRSA